MASGGSSLTVRTRLAADHEYLGYFPSGGLRRVVVLGSQWLFLVSHIAQTVGSLAVALYEFPLWLPLAVLASDCALHHATWHSAAPADG